MISLTGGLIDATRNFQSAPKCHRKFRCCYMARNVASISPERGSGNDPASAMNEYEGVHWPQIIRAQGCAIDLAQTSVLIVSKGARYELGCGRPKATAEDRSPKAVRSIERQVHGCTCRKSSSHSWSIALALDEMKDHLVRTRVSSSRSTPKMVVAPLSLVATAVAADQSEEHHACRLWQLNLDLA